MDFKNTLRREIDNKLTKLDDKESSSKKACIKLFNTNEWLKAKKIFLYITFKNEFQTSYIIDKAIENSKEIYAPLIEGKNMTFHRIDNLKNELIINKYGIKEPPKNLDESVPDKDSIIIVPGVAFSTKGERLGRGGGFYDRYLEKNRNCKLIAMAFNVQIVDNIPTQEWDQKVDIIITEENIWRVENGN